MKCSVIKEIFKKKGEVMNKQRYFFFTIMLVFAIALSAVFANASDYLVSQNLGSSAYSASSTFSDHYPYKAFDGDLTTEWTNIGSVSAGSNIWIEANLGRVYDLSSISLTVRQGHSDRETTHNVYASTSPIGADGSFDYLTGFTGYTSEGDVLSSTFGDGTLAQYVQVNTTEDSDWVEWYEIQIYAHPGTLCGKVTDNQSPVAGATVSTSDGKYSTTTKDDGSYTLPLPAGVATFVVSKDGYLTTTAADVNIAAETQTNKDFELLSQSNATLTGTVCTNENGFPVAAGVTVSTSDGNYVCVTDTKGYYGFALPSGTYTITAKKDGYVDATANVTIDATKKTVTNLTLVSTTLGIVSGKVTSSASGNPPLAGVTVKSLDGTYSTTTGADGSYRLALSPSTTAIYATDSTHVTSFATISVGAEQELKNVDFSMDDGILLSQGLASSAYTASSSYSSSASDVFDGNFTTPWIAPSSTSWVEVDLGQKYYITKVLLCPNAAGSYENDIWLSSSAIGDSKDGAVLAHTFTGDVVSGSIMSCDLPAGTVAQHVQVATQKDGWNSWYEVQVFGEPIPTGTISGKVSSTQAGIAGIAGVTVKTADGSYSTVTKDDGSYLLTVPEGKNELVASKDGYIDAHVSATVVANNNTPLSIDLVKIVSASNSGDMASIKDGYGVKFNNPLVATSSSTTFTDGSYYLEAQDRSFAIKAINSSYVSGVVAGEKANFTGIIGTDVNGERFIKVTAIDNLAATNAITPLGMNNKAVLGQGLVPKDLLIKIWGKVTYFDPSGSFMYVDDGSNMNDDNSGSYSGVKVVLNGTNDPGLATAASEGENVSVTGIASGAYSDAGKQIVVIKPRSAVDVVNNADKFVTERQSDVNISTEGGVNGGKDWSILLNSTDTTSSQSFANDGLFCNFGSDYTRVRCMKYGGTPLKDITELKYSTYMGSVPTDNSTYSIQLCIDTTGAGDQTCDDVIICRPYLDGNTGKAAAGTWQVWDVLNNGTWWSENKNAENGFTEDTPGSLKDYIAKYPNAILVSPSASTGSIYWQGVFSINANMTWYCNQTGYNGKLGSVTVGTQDDGTTVYSFAPDTEKPADFKLQTSFRINNTQVDGQALVCMRQASSNTPSTGYFLAILPQWSTLNNKPSWLLMLNDGTTASHNVAYGSLGDSVDWTKFHTVSVTAIGNSWSGTFDGSTIFNNVEDPGSKVVLGGGYLGIGCINSNVDFDYIDIGAPESTTPSIFDTFSSRTVLGTTEDSHAYPWLGATGINVGGGYLNSTASGISVASIQ